MLRKRAAHFASEDDVDNFMQAIDNFKEKLQRARRGGGIVCHPSWNQPLFCCALGPTIC